MKIRNRADLIATIARIRPDDIQNRAIWSRDFLDGGPASAAARAREFLNRQRSADLPAIQVGIHFRKWTSRSSSVRRSRMSQRLNILIARR